MTAGRKPTISILDAPDVPNDLSLFGLKNEQLTAILNKFSAPAYRSRQLSQALYSQGASTLDEVTTLSKEFRQQLTQAGYTIGLPQIVETFRSVDGTERYLVSTSDGQTIETVWMPEGDNGESGDGTEAATHHDSPICISSQIGCAVNCQFCLTAKLGIKRNLTAGEIAGQVVAVLNRHGIKIGADRINLVFMGMGEPFLNYDEFIRSVHLLVKPIGIPESRMTVSTSGIEPSIRRFAGEPLRPKLALSLNASNDT